MKIKLIPVTELARRGQVCSETLKRRLAAAGLEPDAIVIAGRKRIPAFEESRAAQILDLFKN